MVTPAGADRLSLTQLDDATRRLVRLAAQLAAASEQDVRVALQAAHGVTPNAWIEELLLQTYLFAGFPRALNGMREWRRIAAITATPPVTPEFRQAIGEATCATVYGAMYQKLRVNIRQLHPQLDEWMIEEGYGKVLSRPALDLPRRELCIVAACAATGQDRQLQSHLHGARNVGVPGSVVRAALDGLADLMDPAAHSRTLKLWARIDNDVH
ncbi:MAG TPA: carboxymuconolactone decarboxylase family protein [Gemmatimonadaceae bacterium]|nr:carboxymuconolactone decarboxylase family protein [Gemmatimonadaceae bacterium]